ncbi:MAG: hypothetical protein KBD83_01715 [Gammaproteobacteria bacterium]|nr:hypothetical protein [Gammaproteobacteria bacterium]
MLIVPYKSVAAALVLAVLLGPIGVFYASFVGGIVMCIFGLVAIGTMASMHSPLPMVTVCLFGIVWAMAAVRFYNYKMLKIAVNGCFGDPVSPIAQKLKKNRGFFRKEKIVKDEQASEVTPETPDAEDGASAWKL